MITGTELRHFKSANANPVKVFSVFGQTTIADIQRKFAVCLLIEQFAQFMDMLCKGAAFSPHRYVPFFCQCFRCQRARDGKDK